MSEEDVDLQAKVRAMTPFQQEQLNCHIAGYRKTLLDKRPPIEPHSINLMVKQFTRTLIIQVSKRAPQNGPASKAVAPPPKPHPLSVQGPVPIAVNPVPSVVKKQTPVPVSLPLPIPAAPQKPIVPTMQVALGNQVVTIPVSLKDWIARLYSALPSGDIGARLKADSHVQQLVGKAIKSGAVMTTDWRFFPVPTFPQTPRTEPEFIPISKTPKKTKETKKPGKTAVILAPSSDALSSEELQRRKARAEKYQAHLNDQSGGSSPELVKAEVQYEFGDDAEDVFNKTGQYSVIGTCRTLEKSYFRLTSAPDPALVRPPSILAAHMKNLEIAVRQKSRDYKWLSDQVRAVRQDLTVQGVKGKLATAVYEWNARLALENEDIGQFNQCQTQIKDLHAEMDNGEETFASLPGQTATDSKAEFLSYSLLYFALQGMRVDQQRFMMRWTTLPNDLKRHRFVSFAFDFRQALALGDFATVFRLYNESASMTRKLPKRSPKKLKTSHHEAEAPSHAHFLIHAFIQGLRLEAVSQVAKSFMTLPADWLQEYLGLASEDELRDLNHEEFFVWKNAAVLDCRATFARLKDHPQLAGKKLEQMG